MVTLHLAPPAPPAPLALVQSLFEVDLDLSQRNPEGTIFMLLARLTGQRHRMAVTLPNIQMEMTLTTWRNRDVRRGTGDGVFRLRVWHRPDVNMTSERVTQWFMATFPPRTLLAEQVRVTEIVPVEVREQDRALAVNVFYPVILLVSQPPFQT